MYWDSEKEIFRGPVKMADNLYFVGNRPTSSHIVVTPQGLLMFDTPYPEGLEDSLGALRELGYTPEDIRWIIITHGHIDHYGCVNLYRKLTDAQVYISEIDSHNIHNNADYPDVAFTPDRTFHDGDVLDFGGTKVTCVHTPGHTKGTFSFFFDVMLNGRPVRAGMFGGVGRNTINAVYFLRTGTSYFARREFFASIARLRSQKVELQLGNHAHNNDTIGRALRVEAGESEAFYEPEQWPRFLDWLDGTLTKKIASDAKKTFVNFAHRGASEAYPENTMLAFAGGVMMGANGVETDVRETADGVLVLHHDASPARLGGVDTPIREMTYAELSAIRLEKNGFTDKIPTLEEFLQLMAHRDLQFAIEIKAAGITEKLLALLNQYKLKGKCRITSFELPYLLEVRQAEPGWRLGYLTKELSEETLQTLFEKDIDEVCPKAELLDESQMTRLRRLGFRIRAWGVTTREEMKRLYDLGVDGMTVDFPDALTAYIAEKSAE